MTLKFRIDSIQTKNFHCNESSRHFVNVCITFSCLNLNVIATFEHCIQDIKVIGQIFSRMKGHS